MSVHHQEGGPLGIVDQPLQELDEALAVHPSLDHHEAQRTLGSDRRDHVQAEAAAAALHLWRLPDGCPGGAAVVVGADARFVAEEDLSTLLPGQLLDSQELDLPPALDSLGVLLVGAVERLLRAQAHAPEQAPHRTLAEADLPLAPDQLLDHRPRPEAVREAELQRVLSDYQLVQ